MSLYKKREDVRIRKHSSLKYCGVLGHAVPEREDGTKTVDTILLTVTLLYEITLCVLASIGNKILCIR